MKRERYTHPIKRRDVTQGTDALLSGPSPDVLNLNFLRVTNSHLAFSPSGVSSAFQVLSEIVPSGEPVARTQTGVYSRSWKESAVMGGYFGDIAPSRRSSTAMGRALTVWSQSLSREQDAMCP